MKVALITGAAKGIGAAVAPRSDSQYDSLALMDVDGDGLASTRDQIRSSRVELVVGTVVSSADCARAVHAARALGDLAAVSHNAGIQRYDAVGTTTEAVWDEVFAVNLEGALLISQAAMPLLRQSNGSVVHMASVQGLAAQPAKAEEIADVVAFLLSPAAAVMTGEVVRVDGGLTARPGGSPKKE